MEQTSLNLIAKRNEAIIVFDVSYVGFVSVFVFATSVDIRQDMVQI